MKVDIYSKGIVSCSVCVPKNMTREEIEKHVNQQSPTGIESAWKIAKAPKFASGHNNPCACKTRPHHIHYLLHC